MSDKSELAPIDVTVRFSAGAYVATARGKSASCTSGERMAVERLARKISPDLRPLIECMEDLPPFDACIRRIWRITWQPRP